MMFVTVESGVSKIGFRVNFCGKQFPLPLKISFVAFVSSMIGFKKALYSTFCDIYIHSVSDRHIVGNPNFSMISFFDRCDFCKIAISSLSNKFPLYLISRSHEDNVAHSKATKIVNEKRLKPNIIEFYQKNDDGAIKIYY